MQKLVWQNSNGDEINLTGGNYGITNWEGFANTSLNIQSQQVPFQDGGVFLDALMEQRELSVTLAMYDGGNLETRYRMRRELVHALNPKLGEGYLIYTNDFISKRIKCVAQIPLFETHNSNDSGTPKASLSWTACAPYWEDLEEKNVLFSLDSMPLIENKGDVDIPVKIDLYTNNINNAEIENVTTRQKIKLNGVVNKNIFINTNAGQKEVYSQDINISVCNTMLGKVVESPYGYFAIRLGNIVKTNDNKRWFCKFSLTSSQTFRDIIYSKEKDMFVAISGTVAYVSSDGGENWSSHTITELEHYYASFITYDINTEKFLIICKYSNSNDSIIFSSEDGISWESVLQQRTDIDIILFINDISKYIVCTYSTSLRVGYIKTGADLNNLTTVYSANGSKYKSVAYSALQNKIVVMAQNNLVVSVDNGINWEDKSIDTQENFLEIAHSNSSDIFLAITVNGIWASVNAIYWNKKYNFDENNSNARLFFSESQSVFIISGNIYMGTPNGEDIVFKENIGLYLTNNKDVLYSHKNKEYLLITYRIQENDENLLYSKDGHNWFIRNVFENTKLYCLAYSQKLDTFIIGASINNIAKVLLSKDAQNWNINNFPSNGELTKIIYSEEKEKAIAIELLTNYKSISFISDDLINWNNHYLFDTEITDVVYSNKFARFTVVGNAGFISNSEDGINWTNVSTTQSYSLRGICFSELLSLYIAVGTNGTILYSVDSIKWVKIDIDIQKNLNSVHYCESNGLFIIVGENGVYITSYDGYNWEIKNININNTLRAITNNEQILIVGDNINLMSENTEKENVISRLSNESDMNFKLLQGNNRLKLSRTSGNVICNISYRQKYIGV